MRFGILSVSRSKGYRWFMTDYLVTYQLSRGRFASEVEGLNQEQLNWKPYPAALSIGEMALHVAGVELWFTAQIKRESLSGEAERLAKTATEGVVNENPFPYSAEEITPELVAEALTMGRAAAEELIALPSDTYQTELQSALGPVIKANGALARMTFHPGYHHGQAYQIKMDPRFPA